MAKNGFDGRRRVLGLGGGVAAMAALGHSPAQAAVTTIHATTISPPLTSSADRIISYRFQERMWQTPDGGTHLIINRGSLSPTGALVMCSSFDNGRTWLRALILSNSDFTSTCDGQMTGNDLNLVFSTTDRRIMQTVLRYDPVARTWRRVSSATVYSLVGTTALSPAVVTDGLGAMWCSYVTQNDSTLDTVLRLSCRSRPGVGWSTTGQTFGAADTLGVERAGRPVRLAGGVGMIYTWHDDIVWATRADGAAVTSAWTLTPLWRSDPPGSGGRGEWGGHYSMVTDLSGNIHLVTADMGRVAYFRYLASPGMWEPMRPLTGNIGASYTQVTLCEGSLVVVANNQTQSQVWQSDNLGATFRLTANLRHAAATTTITYDAPRQESPGVSRSPVPVLQLYSEGTTRRLMYFAVPLAR
jgi:hypothetical protein